jgi:hypothetical protein
MVRNYLGFFLLGCWLSAAAWGAQVQVGDLSLSYAPPWERAASASEAADASAILRWRGAGGEFTVFLPRHQVELRLPEARFRRQLEQSWRSLHGADARIYPLSLAGTTWQVCRHPSIERDATVFELVAVHAGRVQHVLVNVGGRVETLPDPAQALLASAVWGGTHSIVLGESSREDEVLGQALSFSLPTTPPAGQEGSPAPGKAESTEAAQASRLAEAEGITGADGITGVGWRLARTIPLLPQGARLAELARAETQALGARGMLLGYGLTAWQRGVEGFVEGVLWSDATGVSSARQPFARRWQVDWQPPEAIGAGEQTWAVSIGDHRVEGWTGPAPMLNLGIDLHALCGRQADLVAVFNGLANAVAGAERKLAKFACPGVRKPLHAEAALGPGSTTAALTLRLPESWVATRLGQKDKVKRLLAVATYPPARPDPGLGDTILGSARAYYVYVPRE